MKEPRQRICESIGSEGCYFLSIVYLAEKILKERVDVLELYDVSVYAGIMEPDCFVNKPEKLLQLMVPGKWEVVKVNLEYELQPEDLEIVRYERPTTGKMWTHFVVGDGAGGVEYDPLGESLCVSQGRRVSRRVFRKVG